ncbi:MAG: two-component system, OmpR family, sensor kinase [Actinomycetota bacterium]|jgi:signal transduction histidine kinase|nr:two-component system, OmpR family, sensor kinase [Actinomycetota bacterium]
MSEQRERHARGPRFSVRSRILAAILLVAVLGLAGAGVTTYLVLRMHILAGIDAQLISRVAVAREVSEGASSPDAALSDILAKLIPNAHEGSMGILDGVPRYKPGVATDLALDGSPAFVTRVGREVAGGSVWLGTTSLNPRSSIRYIAVPITVKGAAQSGVYVDAVDLDAELADLDSAVVTYFVVALVACVAIGLVGWFVAGRLLRPIRRLSAAASRITASDRNERIPVAGRDDISELTGTVNDMLDRLDAALTGQRQLLDDVRHELKTPITIVRGHLELLDVASASDVRATRALAIDELDRMSRLVDDIEALAETHAIDPRETDVADLTAEVFAKVSVLPGHDWELDEVAHVRATLDPHRITQAWLQLADNAAKYSPKGTVISLGSRADEVWVEFWVSDHGPGIPSESRERVFERFGRVDSRRGIRGSGLGLPIVAAIAEAHGGRVTLDTSVAGSRFAIVVPFSPEVDE